MDRSDTNTNTDTIEMTFSAQLTPDLLDSLAVRMAIVADAAHHPTPEQVAACINLPSLAACFDPKALADDVNCARVAACMHVPDVAECIDTDTVAELVADSGSFVDAVADQVAENLDLSTADVANELDAWEIASNLDAGTIADVLADKIDIDDVASNVADVNTVADNIADVHCVANGDGNVRVPC